MYETNLSNYVVCCIVLHTQYINKLIESHGLRLFITVLILSSACIYRFKQSSWVLKEIQLITCLRTDRLFTQHNHWSKRLMYLKLRYVLIARPAAKIENKNCQSIIFLISGLWTDWTEWSACSTSCGGGARSRTRKCAAGQICAGNNRDWQICNHQCCKGELNIFYICHRRLGRSILKIHCTFNRA